MNVYTQQCKMHILKYMSVRVSSAKSNKYTSDSDNFHKQIITMYRTATLIYFMFIKIIKRFMKNAIE